MNPSKATLDRLPKALSSQWESGRNEFEKKLWVGEQVPKAAVAVGVSLDGVLVPMKHGERKAKRTAQQQAGKTTVLALLLFMPHCATMIVIMMAKAAR